MNVAVLLNQRDAELFLSLHPKEKIQIIAGGIDTFAHLNKSGVSYQRLTKYFDLQRTRIEWNIAKTISSGFLNQPQVSELFKSSINYRYPIHQHLKYLLTDIVRNQGISEKIIIKNKPAICYISNTMIEPLVQKLHNQEFTLFNHVFIQICKQENIQVSLIQNNHYLHYLRLMKIISKLLVEAIINMARSAVGGNMSIKHIDTNKKTILFSASNHLLKNTKRLVDNLRQQWNTIVIGKLKKTDYARSYAEKNLTFISLNGLIRYLSFTELFTTILLTAKTFIGFLLLPEKSKRQYFNKKLGGSFWSLIGPSLSLYSSLLVYEITLYSKYIERLWKATSFNFILASNNIDPFHFALLSFAKNHTIPYALIIHDAQGNTFCDFFYKPDDTLLVWGNFQKRLISKEFPTLRCIATGHPDFDDSLNDPQKNPVPMNLSAKQRLNILVLTTYNPYIQFPNQEVLFDVFTELNKIKQYQISVTLKSHPSEHHAKLVNLVKESVNYPLRLSFENADRLIEANDIIITQSTSAGFRAILSSKPTIYLNIHDYKDYEPYAKKGAALGVYSLNQLNPSIKTLIKYPNLCEKNQIIFSRDFCYKLDGRAAERIIEYIQAVINAILPIHTPMPDKESTTTNLESGFTSKIKFPIEQLTTKS